MKAELDIVECVLFENLTPEGMYYAAGATATDVGCIINEEVNW